MIVSRFPAGALEQELVNARRRAIAEAPVKRIKVDGRSYRLRRLPDGLDQVQPERVDFHRGVTQVMADGYFRAIR